MQEFKTLTKDDVKKRLISICEVFCMSEMEKVEKISKEQSSSLFFYFNEPELQDESVAETSTSKIELEVLQYLGNNYNYS